MKMLIAFKIVFLEIVYSCLWPKIIGHLSFFFILKILGPFLLLRASETHLTVDVTFLPVHVFFFRLLSSPLI